MSDLEIKVLEKQTVKVDIELQTLTKQRKNNPKPTRYILKGKKT